MGMAPSHQEYAAPRPAQSMGVGSWGYRNILVHEEPLVAWDLSSQLCWDRGRGSQPHIEGKGLWLGVRGLGGSQNPSAKGTCLTGNVLEASPQAHH